MKELKKISNPKDVYSVVKSWAKKEEENFLSIILNGAHEVITIHHVSKGLVNKTVVHPRECFKEAIRKNAVSVIFVHNHPSGVLTPSLEDKDITRRLSMAANVIGIHLLDHLIISTKGFYSFSSEIGIQTDFPRNELYLFSKSFTYDSEIQP